MRRTAFRIVILVAALAWPVVTFADAPPDVTNLSAHVGSSQIVVHWDAPENSTDITSYRIYYGQKSILGNDGAYDDFATSDGAGTDYTFTAAPPYQQIFLGVAAVNAAGEESPSFVEEIQLDLTQQDTDGQKMTTDDQHPAVDSPSKKQHDASTLGLTSAVADSPSTVRLTFTTTVHVPLERATEAFAALDEEANPLQLRRIVIQGNIVTLTTDPQIPGKSYAVRANDVITGQPTPDASLPMDPQRNIVTFTGFGNPSDAPPAPPSTMQPPVGSAIPLKTPSGSGLPSSGLPLAGLLLASGACTGWMRMRKKV